MQSEKTVESWMLAREQEQEPTFRTDEMDPGETAPLAQMLAANQDESGAEELCEWLLVAAVGEEWRDIVTVTRVT